MKYNLGKESALRPTENNKPSESSTPISCEDKTIISAETQKAFHEPDVIASTKVSSNGIINVETDRPVAPPRRRRCKLINVGTKAENNSNVCRVLNNNVS